MADKKKILLTGATGYVGGHLLKRLEQDAYEINCLVRDPNKLMTGSSKTHVFKGDVLEPETLYHAFESVDTAFYLIHSLSNSDDFAEHERTAACNFIVAARRAGVQRIIYLGGLGNEKDGLSPHLRSRQVVGRILRESGIPTIELRASIILGAGSISFEMIRALTEHLPFMVVPKWVSIEAQPISISDVLDYLIASLDTPLASDLVVEIGGTDRVSYGDLMQEYARQRKLKRFMLRVPVLTPWLSSHWLGLVTPLYARVGRKLIEGVRNRTIVEHTEHAECFDLHPCSMAEAIRRALADEHREFEEDGWLDRTCVGMGEGHRVLHHRNLLIDCRQSNIDAKAYRLFETLKEFGTSKGMFAWNGLWRLRAFVDRCMGGKHSSSFRAVAVVANRRIRFKACMKLPGEAWMEFSVKENSTGSLCHAIIYNPKGLLGLLYWYAVYPVHALVFRDMHKAILKETLRDKPESMPHPATIQR